MRPTEKDIYFLHQDGMTVHELCDAYNRFRYGEGKASYSYAKIKGLVLGMVSDGFFALADSGPLVLTKSLGDSVEICGSNPETGQSFRYTFAGNALGDACKKQLAKEVKKLRAFQIEGSF